MPGLHLAHAFVSTGVLGRGLLAWPAHHALTLRYRCKTLGHGLGATGDSLMGVSKLGDPKNILNPIDSSVPTNDRPCKSKFQKGWKGVSPHFESCIYPNAFRCIWCFLWKRMQVGFLYRGCWFIVVHLLSGVILILCDGPCWITKDLVGSLRNPGKQHLKELSSLEHGPS